MSQTKRSTNRKPDKANTILQPNNYVHGQLAKCASSLSIASNVVDDLLKSDRIMEKEIKKKSAKYAR
jgi:hypothetical protein